MTITYAQWKRWELYGLIKQHLITTDVILK